MAKTVTIIGGGLAGLTLGIGLRQRGVPVTLWEAGTYPRHRVCGEFISGRGLGVLSKLGLLEPVLRAGAQWARSAAFFIGENHSPARRLHPRALCLSRYELDRVLAEAFVRTGGELRTERRWRGDMAAEGVVNASGRRPIPCENGWRWFGLKVHARGVELSADVEMHVVKGGYVGLCKLGAAEVNVCGLFRRPGGTGERKPSSGAYLRDGSSAQTVNQTRSGLSPLSGEKRRSEAHPASGSWTELLRGASGSALAGRFHGAQFLEESFRSVAGLGLLPGRAAGRPDCTIGDALTMIAPVTGNGMSMAFEGGALAIEPLCAWSRGEIGWPQARGLVAQACDRRFRSRLGWARLLQWGMFSELLCGRVGGEALHSERIWRLLFRQTR